MKQNRLDANESVFFARQLETISARVQEVQYPNLLAANGTLFPITAEASPGAETISYTVYDRTGVAKIIANYADDLARAEVKGKQYTSTIKSIGVAYGYSIQEIRAAIMTGMPLVQRKANAARSAYEEKLDSIAYYGDAEYGIIGALYNPTIPKTSAAKTVSTMTAAEMITYFTTWLNIVPITTKGIEQPDTIAIALSAYSALATKQMDNLNVTVLTFLRSLYPQITWIPDAKLDALTVKPSTNAVTATKALLIYKRDPMVVNYEVPVQFEQFAPEQRNLEYVVDCHARVAGVVWHRPLAAYIVDCL